MKEPEQKQKVVVLNRLTSCQTLSSSSQVRHRDPGKGNEGDVSSSSSSSTKTHRPKAKHWTPSCSRGAAPCSTLQDYTWTGQLPGVCVCAYVFDVWPLSLWLSPSNFCRGGLGQCQGQFLLHQTFIRRFYTTFVYPSLKIQNDDPSTCDMWRSKVYCKISTY